MKDKSSISSICLQLANFKNPRRQGVNWTKPHLFFIYLHFNKREQLNPNFTRSPLATGEMPEDLKCAMLRPLLKKSTADHKVFANFRPVSNLKYISKLIEKAVAVQLNDHLARNDLHVPFQSAYRSCHSTESAFMRVHNDIMISLDNGNSVILVLLDLSAAFDTVNHDLLLSRLEKRFGITGTVLNWFKSYLCNRSQFVSINQSHSTKRDLLVGVPQGSVLGPLSLVHTCDITT